MLLGVVERKPLLRLLAGWGKIAQARQGYSQRSVGLYQERRVVFAVGQAQELLCQLAGSLQLGLDQIARK